MQSEFSYRFICSRVFLLSLFSTHIQPISILILIWAVAVCGVCPCMCVYTSPLCSFPLLLSLYIMWIRTAVSFALLALSPLNHREPLKFALYLNTSLQLTSLSGRILVYTIRSPHRLIPRNRACCTEYYIYVFFYFQESAVEFKYWPWFAMRGDLNSQT